MARGLVLHDPAPGRHCRPGARARPRSWHFLNSRSCPTLAFRRPRNRTLDSTANGKPRQSHLPSHHGAQPRVCCFLDRLHRCRYSEAATDVISNAARCPAARWTEHGGSAGRLPRRRGRSRFERVRNRSSSLRVRLTCLVTATFAGCAQRTFLIRSDQPLPWFPPVLAAGPADGDASRDIAHKAPSAVARWSSARLQGRRGDGAGSGGQ